jgi:hypothetical protein
METFIAPGYAQPLRLSPSGVLSPPSLFDCLVNSENHSGGGAFLRRTKIAATQSVGCQHGDSNWDNARACWRMDRR